MAGVAVEGFDDDGFADFVEQLNGIVAGFAVAVLGVWDAVLAAELPHEVFVGIEGGCFGIECRNVEFPTQFGNERHGDVALVGHDCVDVVVVAVGYHRFAVEDVGLEVTVGMAECRRIGRGVYHKGVVSHFAYFVDEGYLPVGAWKYKYVLAHGVQGLCVSSLGFGAVSTGEGQRFFEGAFNLVFEGYFVWHRFPAEQPFFVCFYVVSAVERQERLQLAQGVGLGVEFFFVRECRPLPFAVDAIGL